MFLLWAVSLLANFYLGHIPRWPVLRSERRVEGLSIKSVGSLGRWAGVGAVEGGKPSGWRRCRLGAPNFALLLPFPAQHVNDVFFSWRLLVELWWCLEATIHPKSAGLHEGPLEELF